ncbi:MAG: XRE family transcriptional regulator [Planctomycetota bacterium]|jgi:DNA-binding XRE family transcriptional regulator
MMAKKRKTSDAVKILHDRYIKNDPEMAGIVQDEREKSEVAREIYNIRKNTGLTQAELAKEVGTTQSVISCLENADYNGHSLEMLRRIAHALHCRVEVHIVPEDTNSYSHAG